MPVDTTNPDKLVLTAGADSAEVYYFGATLTSWKVDGQERIFLSKDAILNGTKAIRGGIPLVFPHFGTVETSKLPQHGFARNSRWELLPQSAGSDSETVVQLSLKPAQVPESLRSLWPNDFQLIYTVKLSASNLTTTLDIKNTDSKEWEFTSLLHTYFRIQDVAKVGVRDLTGRSFVDKVAKGARDQELRDVVTIASEVDRVYENVEKNEIHIVGTGLGKDVVVHKKNFPDVVVWNPWVEKAKGMADFGDEEYHNMICVEVGKVADFVKLAPGESWSGSQTLIVA
ncbi:hypothetical protein HK097_006345 [Rhizophlyctis rosea]|uniref:Glucose-6-phosphate 1-epimerase n=1 Tax=Rhizophlyctis rosea TaxID=64517 RepID=A0AAD5X562_9FUNG|nr:hypothetical protein HK097_006345 [Rhizophlyctis rosea]